MTREKIQELFRDRKKFTYESLERTCLANLPQEMKDELVNYDYEEFFADCDEDSIDCSNTHSMLLSSDVDERFL